MLAACSPAINSVPGVNIVNADDVFDCTLIGRVRTTPGVFGPLRDVGLQDAQKRALELAKGQGGNAIVFDALPVGQEVFELNGQVYKC